MIDVGVKKFWEWSFTIVLIQMYFYGCYPHFWESLGHNNAKFSWGLHPKTNGPISFNSAFIYSQVLSLAKRWSLICFSSKLWCPQGALFAVMSPPHHDASGASAYSWVAYTLFCPKFLEKFPVTGLILECVKMQFSYIHSNQFEISMWEGRKEYEFHISWT